MLEIAPKSIPTQIATAPIQVINTTGVKVYNLNLRDFMREDPGTPPHDVEVLSFSCSPNICTGGGATFVQSQLFYFSTKQMWSGTIPTLGPFATVMLTITVEFTNPTCDSLDATAPNTNTNFARASYQANVPINGVPTLVTYYLLSAFKTQMADVPKCQFKVRKRFLGPHPIAFPKTVHYRVRFKSNEVVPRDVVVYDALRVVPVNYTSGMPFTATYSCTPNPLGSVTGPIPGFPVPSTTPPGTVVNTVLPSQGARIFQSAGFLTFAPGATLSCDVNVKVSRPPPSDPFCLGTAPGGQLENLAYMTVSQIPNNNVFPPSGSYNGVLPLATSQPPGPLSNWRSLTDLLPRCYDLVVNKTVSPTTTWTPGGPALTYTLDVTNQGDDPIVQGGLNNPELTDLFTPPKFASSFTLPVCILPPSPLCLSFWSPPPTAPSPSSKLRIIQLAKGQTIHTTFTVPPPFTVPVQCNTAAAAMGGPNGAQLWYPRNPATLADTTCVPVLETNSLTVEKQVSPPSGGFLPDFTGVEFLVDVVCTPGPSASLTFTAGGPSQVIPNIPVGSVCHVVEQPLASTGTCGRPLVSFAMPPTYVPGQDVTITAPPPATFKVVVNNVIGCVQMRSLEFFKAIVNLTGGALPNDQFPVTITCLPFGNVVNLTLSATNPFPTVSLPVGSTCTVVEGPLPPPVNSPVCTPGTPTGAPVGWAPPIYTTTLPPSPVPPSIIIPTNPPNPQVRIDNTYKCNP